MNPVKILKIWGTNDTSKGKVTRVNLKTLDLDEVLNVSIFHNECEFTPKVGDEFGLDIREGKPYKGKKTYTASANTICDFEMDKKEEPKKEDTSSNTETTETPEPAFIEEVAQSTWDKKDRRITRLSTWNIANSILELAIKDKEDESTLFERAKFLAHAIEDDVYRGL